jgi:hypothetical protein|uniref:Uncharacterized protein n=1 Tax=Bionectria ochroleuca TaxID=29856 RepID=A0A8H7KFJ7_BIOOC
MYHPCYALYIKYMPRGNCAYHSYLAGRNPLQSYNGVTAHETASNAVSAVFFGCNHWFSHVAIQSDLIITHVLGDIDPEVTLSLSKSPSRLFPRIVPVPK